MHRLLKAQEQTEVENVAASVLNPDKRHLRWEEAVAQEKKRPRPSHSEAGLSARQGVPRAGW